MRKLSIHLVLCMVALLGHACAQKENSSGTGATGGVSGFQQNGTPQLQITTSALLPTATIGTPYSQTLVAQFGVGALTWTISSGSLPNGITMNSSGVFSGTPGNNAGNFTFVVQVTDSSSPTPQVAVQTFTLPVVCTPLQILTTSPLPAADQGAAYSFQMLSQGGIAPLTWSATGLPTGESISSSGSITGTPSVNGSFTPQISVSDSCPLVAQTASGAFSESVNATLALTTSNPLPAGTVGVPYTTQFAAAGGSTPYSFSLPSGTLPSGLLLNSSTGVLAGTPTAPQANSFTIQVADSLSNTVSRLFSLAVACPALSITSTSLPNGTQNSSYSFQMQSSGGFGSQTWTASGLPSGLVISSTGLIGGTPTVFGSFTVVVSVTDSCPNAQTASQSFTLSIAQAIGPLTIQTSSPLPAATVGQPYNQQFSATGGLSPYNWAIVSGAFQTGLGFSATGILSGTPTTSGTVTPTVSVTDTLGTTVSGAFSLTASCPALSITSSATLPQGTQNQAYSFQLIASGGVTPFSWTLIGGSFPAGITLSSSGAVSGTPTATGTFHPQVQVADSCLPSAQTQSQTLTLVIAANSGPLTITTTSPLPGGTQGVAYSDQLVATGGTPPYSWTTSAGSPPAGIMLSGSGSLSGTPTSSGTSSFTAKVTDAIAGTATQPLSLTISCPAISITSTSPLPQATQGQPYSFQFTSSGGVAPITWTATGVPAGLTLATSGLLSGTPSTSGNNTLSVTATDSCLPTHGTANTSFSLTVGIPVSPLQITTTTPLPPATEGQAYNVQMTAQGGVTPYTWAKTAGSFPAGVTMTTSGVISGTPTATGTVTPTIQVTDAQPVSTSTVFTIVTSCPSLAITTASTLPSGTQGSSYLFQMTGSGGINPLSWSASGLPTGLTISSAGVISGTPSVSGSFTPSITLHDSCLPSQQTVTQSFTLQINTNLAITTSSPLPSGTVNVAYSTTMSAVGGTPPYTWSVTGSLPTGLTLNASSGVISGTPTTAQTTTPTIKVTDSLSNNISVVFSITINAASGADNRYCNANETVNSTALPQDGPAQPIQNCVRTAVADTPSTGSTVTVSTIGALQSAITNATCGQTIVITSGGPVGPQLSYSGLLKPTATCPRTNFVTVRSDLTTNANFAPEGTRVSPAWVGIASLPGRPGYNQPPNNTPGIYMPKLMNSTNGGVVIQCGPKASGWRFIGLEITSPAGLNTTQLVQCNNNDNHFIFDRVLPHGGNSATWQDKDNVQAGFSFNGSQYMAVVNSYGGDFHCIASTGTCTDSQFIGMGGNATTQSGPIKVVDDFCEAAGECLFTGGGGNGTVTLPATDLELRHIHFWKPLFWKVNDPSYFGVQFVVKNHFEFKNTSRALIEGILAEHTWGQQSDQFGSAGSFGPKNQSSSYSGTATLTNVSGTSGTLTWVSGTQFHSTIISPACAVTKQCLVKVNGISCLAQSFIGPTQVTIGQCASNLPTGGGPISTANFQLQAGPPGSANISDIDFDNSNCWYESDRVTGFWKSCNGAAGPWTNLTAGIPTANQACGASHIVHDPQNDSMIGTVDSCTGVSIATYWRLPAGTTTWIQIPQPSGFMTQFASQQPRAMSLATGGNMVLGGQGCSGCTLMYSSDGGVTTHLSTEAPILMGNARGIFINPFNLHILAGGENGGLFESVNGGAAFNNVFTYNPSFPSNGEIAGITTDCSGNLIFGSISGIWKATGTYPTYSFTFLVQAPQRVRAVYRDSLCSLYFGQRQSTGSNTIMRSLDGGTTWNPFFTGIPAGLEAQRLVQNAVDGMLYADIQNGSTNTGSVYRSPVSSSGSTAVSFTAYDPGLNPTATVNNVTFRYSIIRSASRGLSIATAVSDGGDVALGNFNESIHDIVMDDLNGLHWNLSSGACCVWSVPFQFDNGFPTPNNIDSITVDHVTAIPFLAGSGTPGFITCSTPGCVGLGPGAFFGVNRLTTSTIGHFRFTNNIIPTGWSGGGPGCAGGNQGADAKSNMQCWDTLNSVLQNTRCTDHNLLATSQLPITNAGNSNVANNPPYPGVGDSPGCPFTPTGQTLVTGYNAVQFVNFNNGIGGDYHLQPSSPGHLAGSDGKDLGANIDLVNQMTAGVQ